MGEHRYTLLDVFTDTPLEGNGLAVVHGAGDLDDETMARFARETRLSETSFLAPAAAGGADYRNRIWTVAGELPFAGHPSLGAAVAVARERGEREATYTQQTGAGLQPVDVRVDGDRATASMLQEPAAFGAEVEAAGALAAAGLAAGEGAPGLPPQVVSCGIPHLLVPLADPASLERVKPDFAAIDALLAPHDGVCLYLAWCDPAAGTARARSFTRVVADGEDPATGSAAGPLCAYLAERAGARRIEVVQGVEMGRPSRLAAAIEGDRVRVGGGVVALVDGRLRLR